LKENIQTFVARKPKNVSVPGENLGAVLGSKQDGTEPNPAKRVGCLQFEDPISPLLLGIAKKAFSEVRNLNESGGVVGLGQVSASALKP
jgi:hypothetical protein